MKRRYLKPWIEKALIGVTFLLIVFFGCLEDFEVSFRTIAILFGLMTILVFNLLVLKTYGRLCKEDK